MVLEAYESLESPKYIGWNAIDNMRICKNTLKFRRRFLSSIEISGIQKDYTHYRDVAIKWGMVDILQEISLPKKLR